MAATLDGWRAYALLRGDEAPTDQDEDLTNPALIRGGDLIRFRYLAILRPGITAATIEDIVDEATYIAASLELATPGFFNKTFTASEQRTITQVDAIKWTVTGDASGTYAAMPTSTLIDAMFDPYIIDPDDDGFFFAAIG